MGHDDQLKAIVGQDDQQSKKKSWSRKALPPKHVDIVAALIMPHDIQYPILDKVEIWAVVSLKITAMINNLYSKHYTHTASF